MLAASCTMAFFAFLRCEEFTTQTEYFDPGVHLTTHDITMLPSTVPTTAIIRIKSPKLTPFEEVVTSACIQTSLISAQLSLSNFWKKTPDVGDLA